MYFPKFNSIGPHDAELVDLMVRLTGITSTETLHELVDGINEIFDKEIVEAQWYEEIE